jgi:hypothetical protein
MATFANKQQDVVELSQQKQDLEQRNKSINKANKFVSSLRSLQTNNNNAKAELAELLNTIKETNAFTLTFNVSSIDEVIVLLVLDVFFFSFVLLTL